MARKFSMPNQGARELNEFTSWSTISKGLSNVRSYGERTVENVREFGKIHSQNIEGGNKLRYDQFSSAIGSIRGQVGGAAGRSVDTSINTFLQKLKDAGGHKIGGADLSKAISDLHKEIGQIATTMKGVQGDLLKEFTRDLKEAKNAASSGGLGALGGGTKDAIKTAFGFKADNSLEDARNKIAADVRQAAKSLTDPTLKLAVSQVIGEMHRLANSAKDASEKQKILANAQKKLSALSGRASGADASVMASIVKSTEKNTSELKKSLGGQAATRKGLEFNNRLAQLSHGIGGFARYLAPLKRSFDVGVSVFQQINSKANQFARMQMRISSERGGYGRQVRGAGINYGHMMAAIGAGRTAGMEDREVVGQMVGLQTQLAQARWGEGGLAENVGRWGISVYNEAGGVKQANELMVEFSQKLRSLGSDMEKLQFLHAIGMRPEQMEYVANYEKSAQRMEMLKKNPHLQTVLDKADILDESGFHAKADAATKVELRRREILNQNAISEGVVPGLIRSLNPENWFFNDWTARQKGVQAAQEGLASNKVERAIQTLISETRKGNEKQGKDFLSGFTISDLAALGGQRGGWIDQDKAEKGEMSFATDLESVFEQMTGYSADTRSNLQKAGDAIVEKLKEGVNWILQIPQNFRGFVTWLGGALKNLLPKPLRNALDKNGVSAEGVGTAATIAGGAAAVYGGAKVTKGLFGAVGRLLGKGGGKAALKSASKMRGGGKFGALLKIGAAVAGALGVSKVLGGDEVPEEAIDESGQRKIPAKTHSTRIGGGIEQEDEGDEQEGDVNEVGESAPSSTELPKTPVQGTDDGSSPAPMSKAEALRREKIRRRRNAAEARRRLPMQESKWSWSGFKEGLVKGIKKDVNGVASALTLGLYEGPFSKDEVDLGYEDTLTKIGDWGSTLGPEAVMLALTLGAGATAKGAAKGVVSGGKKLVGETIKKGGKSALKAGKEYPVRDVTKAIKTASKATKTNQYKKAAISIGLVAAANVASGSEEEEPPAETTTPNSQEAPKPTPQKPQKPKRPQRQKKKGFWASLLTGDDDSLMNLVKPIREKIEAGASYEEIEQLLAKHGLDMGDMSVFKSKAFLKDDTKAMDSLKGLGFGTLQRKAIEKYGGGVGKITDFVANMTDKIGLAFKKSGGEMTEEEFLQTWGRQTVGAKDVSNRMLKTYIEKGHKLGATSSQELADRKSRIAREHKDWNQEQVAKAAEKEQRQDFLKGLSSDEIQQYASQGGAITDKATIAKHADELFAKEGITRREAQKTTEEQAEGFKAFLDKHPRMSRARATVQYARTAKLSENKVRNLYGHIFNPEEMDAKTKEEWMQGSDYKEKQKAEEKSRKSEEKKAAEEKLVRSLKAGQIYDYLGQGKGEDFIALHQRVMKGETLDEDEQKAHDDYYQKVTRMAGRSKQTAYQPLHSGSYRLSKGFKQEMNKLAKRQKEPLRIPTTKERPKLSLDGKGLSSLTGGKGIGLTGGEGASSLMGEKTDRVAQASKAMADAGSKAEAAAASRVNATGDSSSGSSGKNITINMGGQTINQTNNGVDTTTAKGIEEGTKRGAAAISNESANSVIKAWSSISQQ